MPWLSINPKCSIYLGIFEHFISICIEQIPWKYNEWDHQLQQKCLIVLVPDQLRLDLGGDLVWNVAQDVLNLLQRERAVE